MPLWNKIDIRGKRLALKWIEKGLSKTPMEPSDVAWNTVRRILVLRSHDQLGDFLLSTPAFRALRGRFPQARIGVLVWGYAADAVVHNPYIDEILVFYKYGPDWTWSRIRSLAGQLLGRWDLAVVLSSESHSLTTDLLAFLSRAPVVLGSESRVFRGCRRNFFYNLTAPDRRPEGHQTDRNLDIVRYIGADTDDLGEIVRVTEVEKDLVRREFADLYDGTRPVIGMHIGGSKAGNRWPVEKFAETAVRLHGAGLRIALFWGPGEEALAEQFTDLVPFTPSPVRPSSLRRIAVHFSLCRTVITNDTGTMHLCAGVGTPLIAVFGPTDPKFWKPIGDQFIAIRGENHDVRNVGVPQVCSAALRLLGQTRPSVRRHHHAG